MRLITFERHGVQKIGALADQDPGAVRLQAAACDAAPYAAEAA
jgi:hypothetical protein